MESAELTDFEDEEDEEDEEEGAALAPGKTRRLRLHEKLGVAVPWLLSNFGRFVFPGHVPYG
jgi:hypothetical protein